MSRTDERVLYIYSNLVGSTVQVACKGGIAYEGILHTIKDDTLSVVLLCARKVKPVPEDSAKVEPPFERLVIKGADFISLTAREMVFVDDHGIRKGRDAGGHGFQTDTAISGGVAGQERQLERWQGGDDGEALEDTGGMAGGGGAWDQFAVNEQRFGVKSSWDESLYTTNIDPEFYKRFADQAAKIASEMEKSAAKNKTRNVHLAEERGDEIDGDMDEEDRYSGVIRSGAGSRSGGNGKYVPPHARGGAGDGGVAKRGGDDKKKDSTNASSKDKGGAAATEKTGTESEDKKGSEAKKEGEADKPKKSSLNPNAKAFEFNPGASEFTPSFGGGGGANDFQPPPPPAGGFQGGYGGPMGGYDGGYGAGGYPQNPYGGGPDISHANTGMPMLPPNFFVAPPGVDAATVNQIKANLMRMFAVNPEQTQQWVSQMRQQQMAMMMQQGGPGIMPPQGVPPMNPNMGGPPMGNPQGQNPQGYPPQGGMQFQGPMNPHVGGPGGYPPSGPGQGPQQGAWQAMPNYQGGPPPGGPSGPGGPGGPGGPHQQHRGGPGPNFSYNPPAPPGGPGGAKGGKNNDMGGNQGASGAQSAPNSGRGQRRKNNRGGGQQGGGKQQQQK